MQHLHVLHLLKTVFFLSNVGSLSQSSDHSPSPVRQHQRSSSAGSRTTTTVSSASFSQDIMDHVSVGSGGSDAGYHAPRTPQNISLSSLLESVLSGLDEPRGLCGYTCTCTCTCNYNHNVWNVFEPMYMCTSYMYLFFYLSIYIYMCIYLYTCIYMYLTLCMYMYLFIHLDIHVYRLYMYLFFYLSIYMYMCIYLYTCIYLTLCMYMYTCVCIYLSILIYMCTCTCIYMYMYLSIKFYSEQYQELKLLEMQLLRLENALRVSLT